MPELILTALNGSPYFGGWDLEDLTTALADLPTIDGTVYAISANSDGTKVAIGGNFTGRLRVFNTRDWSEITFTNKPTYLVRSVKWSPNDNYLSYTSQHNTDSTQIFRVLKTSDWSWEKSNYAFPSNSARNHCWSNNGSYLCVLYGVSPYLRVFNTSDWSVVTLDSGLVLGGDPKECQFNSDNSRLVCSHVGTPFITFVDTSDWSKASTDLTSILPSTVNSVEGLEFSNNGSYLAAAHDDSPYVTVFNTSNWSQRTTTDNPSANSERVRWSDGDSYLISFESSSSPYKCNVMDTTDWTIESDSPTINFAYDIAVIKTPQYNQLISNVLLPGDISWGYSPSEFQGIAIIEGGNRSTSGCHSGSAVRIFRLMGGKYYDYETLQSQGDESELIAFAPGNKCLFHGGEVPTYMGYSSRSDDVRWGAFSSYYWGSMIDGSRPTSMSFSDNGLYRVGTHHDIYEHLPKFEYWDGDSWEKYASITGLQSLAHYHFVAMSPDGKYIAQSTTSGATYNNTPFFFIAENVGTSAFSPMTLDFDSNVFTNSYGFTINWSPDSKTVIAYDKAFQYSETNSQWEIVATLSHDWRYRVAWHPDSTYVATFSGSGTVWIYSVSGSTFTNIKTFSGLTGYVTAVCYSKCGKYFFIGLDAWSGASLLMYDVSGTTYTINTDTNWSGIGDAVVQIDACDVPIEVDAGTLPLDINILISDFFNGQFITAPNNLQSSNLISGWSSLHRGLPFDPVVKFSDDLAFRIDMIIGSFSAQNLIRGERVPTTIAGHFASINSLRARMPLPYEILIAINYERANNTPVLPAYKIDDRLVEAAERHSLDMATNLFVSHTGSDSSSFNDRLDDAGYVDIEAAEMLAMGNKSITGQTHVDNWMSQPANEAVILDADKEDIGIGADLGSDDNNYIDVAIALWHPQYQTLRLTENISTELSLKDIHFFEYLSSENHAAFIEGSKGVHLQRYAIKIGSYLIPNPLSFTYRLELGVPSYLTVNAIFSTAVFNEIESRKDDGISVESIVNYAGGEVRNEVVNVEFTEISVNAGKSPTITIGGYKELRYYSSTVALQNVMIKTIDKDGKTRFRCFQPDFYIRPGCIVTYAGDQFTINKVVIFVNNGVTQYMEVTEG